MAQNPYKVLGLEPGADDSEVTRAYRRLAKKYHPDLNPGDEAAAERMSEINRAYEEIKSGNAQPEGERTNGFGGFGFDFGDAGEQNGYSFINLAESFIRAGRYAEAVNILSNVRHRDARWFYLSAVANSYLGNMITALNHIEQAVRMEPSNDVYLQAMEQIKSGGRAYGKGSSGYGRPICRTAPILSCCLIYTALNLCPSVLCGSGSGDYDRNGGTPYQYSENEQNNSGRSVNGEADRNS